VVKNMINLNDNSLLRQKCYINGKWQTAESGNILEVSNPATGETIGVVPSLNTLEVRQAIEAADKAWVQWRALTAIDRSVILRHWHDLILEHKDDLAQIMTDEQGKLLEEARSEITQAASYIGWFAEEGRRVYGDLIPHEHPDKRIFVLKQPIGVTAAITPWNFPSSMIARKAGAALAAGCTIVVKPSEETPYSALALCELAARAGVPHGVFNVVTGLPQVVGEELTSNHLVRKLSFTGSTEVGKLLMRQCADTLQKITLELGGNAPFIVFDDADIDDADIDAAVVGL
jgi:succinate-semialdehyde dehydrogenase / glutarate-semialdehyde dehydrogenase